MQTCFSTKSVGFWFGELLIGAICSKSLDVKDLEGLRACFSKTKAAIADFHILLEVKRRKQIRDRSIFSRQSSGPVGENVPHEQRKIIHCELSPPIQEHAMEVEVASRLSWEGGHGDIQTEAMEVEVPKRLSWDGGLGDMQGVCAEGCAQEGVYQRRSGGGTEVET